MRLIDHFDQAVATHPQRVFVWDCDRSVTYAEAQIISRRVANKLRDEGITPGSHVAIYSQNSIEACLAVLGVLRSGCVWATFDITAKPDAAAPALSNLDVEFLFYSTAYLENIPAIRSGTTSLRAVACLDGKSGENLENWIGASETEFADVQFSPDDVTTLFSSGGTTGVPKGVMASHRCWEAGRRSTLRHTKVSHRIDALTMPITHAGGGSLLLYGASQGFTFVVIHGFDPEALMRVIQERRVTHIMLAPTALGIILAHPQLNNYDFSSLEALLYGSGPTPPHLVEQAYKALGPVLVTSYGQTETTAGVTVLDQADHKRAFESADRAHLESCGRVLPEFRVEIMDDDGRTLPVGEIGEIVIRGESLMTGYYKASEETAEAARFGWHHTGDIGRKDRDDYLFILDRKRDMIISRGYKIFPAQVEHVLMSHPAVADCAVIGAPHDMLGEMPTAVVVLKRGANVPIDELDKFCRARMGALKSPAKFEIWQALPKSRVGKTLRNEVRAHFWAGRSRKI